MRSPDPNDSGMIFFQEQCNFIADNEVAKLHPQGGRANGNVWLLTGDAHGGTPGVLGKEENNMRQVTSESEIRSGNSGGAVFMFDENGNRSLVGMTSVVIAPRFDGDKHYSTLSAFSKDGVNWARGVLTQRYGANHFEEAPPAKKREEAPPNVVAGPPPQPGEEETKTIPAAPSFFSSLCRNGEEMRVKNTLGRFVPIWLYASGVVEAQDDSQLSPEVTAQLIEYYQSKWPTYSEEKKEYLRDFMEGALGTQVSHVQVASQQDLVELVILSQTTCGPCRPVKQAAKNLFQRLGFGRGLRIIEIDTEGTPPEASRLGFRGTPFIYVRRKDTGEVRLVSGRDEASMKSAFDAMVASVPAPKTISPETKTIPKPSPTGPTKALRDCQEVDSQPPKAIENSDAPPPPGWEQQEPAPKKIETPPPPPPPPPSKPQPRLPTVPLDPQMSDSEAKQIIHQYEKEMRYEGSQKPRYRYNAYPNMFMDVPQQGTGKLIVAYFGPARPDVEAYAKTHPLLEARRYEYGSPEHQEAKLFQVQALALDGLGRKIVRYTQDPLFALKDLANGKEMQLLKKYHQAKALLESKKQSPPKPEPIKAPEKTIEPPETKAPESTENKPTGHPVVLTAGALNNCMSCHVQGGRARAFPNFVHNGTEWARRLEQKDPQAKAWLEKFNSKVVHGEMLSHAGLNKREGIGKNIHDFILSHLEPARARDKSNLGSSQASAMVDPTLLPEYLEVLRKANIKDEKLKAALLDFDAIYDSTGAPPWSWAPHGGDAGRKGQKDISLFTPPNSVQQSLVENVDGKWKWKEPYADGFSIDTETTGIKRFKLVRFPRDAQGNLIQGIEGTEQRFANGDVFKKGSTSFPHQEMQSLWASFPPGTQVFEVQYSTTLGGEPIVIDVLSRTKEISSDGSSVTWLPDAHRPDSSPQKIRNWVNNQPDKDTNPDLKKILQALDHPVRDAIISKIGREGQNARPFILNGQFASAIPGSKSVLPRGINPETLKRMYRDLPLESALGSKGWQLEAHDVFSNSHRGIPIDSKTCKNCHDRAGESFRDVFYAAGLPFQDVHAYGNLSGYDGVLSAPWFSKEDLKNYGTSDRNPSVITRRMRPEWAKFFIPYDRAKHSPQMYRRTEDLQISQHPLRTGN